MFDFEGNELPSEIKLEDQLLRQNSIFASNGQGRSSSPGLDLGKNDNDMGPRNQSMHLEDKRRTLTRKLTAPKQVKTRVIPKKTKKITEEKRYKAEKDTESFLSETEMLNV